VAGGRFTTVWIGQAATLPHLEIVRPALLDAGIPIRVIADRAPEGTELRPWSEETESRDLAECHVGLMPLPDDAYARGKCGYKLLQYYAAGLPAVVSPIGVNRVMAAGGALLAREPGAWVAAVRRLEGDPGLRRSLATAGRAFVERRYAAGPLAARLAHLLENA
jgi:glycosyltransferase involved in cell wall biosynthesis